MILTLDLAAETGYALSKDDFTLIESGTLTLQGKNGIERAEDLKLRLYRMVTERLTFLAYEDNFMTLLNLFRQKGQQRGVHTLTHHAALHFSMMSYAYQKKVEPIGFMPTTIKKYGAGSGKAQKPQMIATAKLIYPGVEIVDDNHADALLVLETLKIKRIRKEL